MKRFLHIAHKELRDYFVSPIAYIVISIFLFITGWFFFSTFFIFGQATLRNFFSLLPIIFSFVIPAVTMRLFSEEINTGSYELLVTMPVTYRDVVMGKFSAAIIFTMLMIFPTLFYVLSVAMTGTVDPGPVAGGYAGALLLGGAYCAIGILSSSLTRNQITAFITGTLVCVTLTLIDKLLFFIPEALLKMISYMGADYHFQNISKGVIDTRDIIYFLSIIFICLYGTHIAIEEKK